jgi:hypothetical protein
MERKKRSEKDATNDEQYNDNAYSCFKRQRLMMLEHADNPTQQTTTITTDDDIDTTRESTNRWRQYRSMNEDETSHNSNLSSRSSTRTEITETSQQQTDDDDEGSSSFVCIEASKVDMDLTEKLNSIASKLESWSLSNLKEWRQKHDQEDVTVMGAESTLRNDVPRMEDTTISDQRDEIVSSLSRGTTMMKTRQKAAKRQVMRALLMGGHSRSTTCTIGNKTTT